MTEHKTLAEALAAAQAEMSNAPEDGKSRFGAYSTLASLRSACIPALSRHGVALVQSVSSDADTVTVSTTLLWGAERMECGSATVRVQPGKANTFVQALGSMVTYLRRYQMGAACGVAAGEDDDGDSAGPMGGTRPPQRQPQVWQQRPPERKAPTLADLQRELKAIWKARGIGGDAVAQTVADRFDGATLKDIWTNGDALADLLALYDEEK